ncbi:rhodanese-like domain-containing protein [Streptosporangium sp. NPDC051023]|uniref:rhodanese-like domain-containing protein n=1 Tax=Streptosporangium sp. NPDC051023 TaxID=3155410 RepID=UPI00344F79E6
MTTSPSPAPLDTATLRGLLEAGTGPRLIDVRTPGEFEAAHVPGSLNVPLDLLREHHAELRGHLDEQTVIICHSGQRAAQAARVLAEAGLPGLRILAGGMTAWRAEGGPVLTGRPRWGLERQVRLVAGSIVAASVLASTVVPKAKWAAAAIGGGLTFAALTDTCAMGMALARLPYNRGPRVGLAEAVAALNGKRG